MTLAAYLVNVSYVAWFWVSFAAGYWVASWFGIGIKEASAAEASMIDHGLLGWLAAIGVGLVAALPSLLGVFLADQAKRAGAGRAATVALVLNSAIGMGWVLLHVLRA